MNYLSLFSGIGGLDLAVESLGFTCVGQVEYDEACTRVLERWWPDVPRWGDVHDFTAATYAARSGRVRAAEPQDDDPDQGRGRGHDAADVREGGGANPGSPDLIIGGFPCQPASTAGRRKGTADDRWLWPEFARVVGELGPRYVLVENVPGLTTVNGGRAFSEVLGTLADLGYDTTWISLRASDVGAPHRRQRLFLLAHTRHPRGRVFNHAPKSRELRDRARGEPRTADGEPRDAHDGGHAPVLRQAHLTGPEAEGEAGTEPGGSGGRVATDTADERHERNGAARGRGTGSQDFRWGPYEPAIQRWERVLNRCAPHPVDDKGRLSPAFVEWMMGFPAGWTDGSSRTQALKQLGNAVVPQQGAAALKILEAR